MYILLCTYNYNVPWAWVYNIHDTTNLVVLFVWFSSPFPILPSLFAIIFSFSFCFQRFSLSSFPTFSIWTNALLLS